MTVKSMTVGDRVAITEGYRKTDTVYHGTVTHVARVWITVQPDIGSPIKFRMDDQTTGTGYASAPRFYTLDQYAQRERELAASQFLKSQGISLNYDSPWRKRETELAELLRTAIETQETTP
jgi:hypothetical protein